MQAARSIGEGVLFTSEDNNEDEETYFGHKFNSFEKVMDVFGGSGSVRLTRAG